MSELFSRRQALLAGSVLGAGLFIQGHSDGANGAERATKRRFSTPASAWDTIKRNFSSPELISSRVTTATLGRDITEVGVESQPFEYKDSAGRILANGYRTTCDPRYITVLKVNGNELRIARQVSFGLGAIEWKAGEGWPIYRRPDPTHDYNIGMKYNAYIHAILVGCLHDNGSITFTANYANPGVYELGAGRVVAFVNDGPGDYGDNRGQFDIEVFGWQ